MSMLSPRHPRSGRAPSPFSARWRLQVREPDYRDRRRTSRDGGVVGQPQFARGEIRLGRAGTSPTSAGRVARVVHAKSASPGAAVALTMTARSSTMPSLDHSPPSCRQKATIDFPSTTSAWRPDRERGSSAPGSGTGLVGDPDAVGRGAALLVALGGGGESPGAGDRCSRRRRIPGKLPSSRSALEGLVEEHHRRVRPARPVRGVEVETEGDASSHFDGPARAVRCAGRSSTRRHAGHRGRAGVHTARSTIDARWVGGVVMAPASARRPDRRGARLQTVKELVRGAGSTSTTRRADEGVPDRAPPGVA